MKDQRPDFSLRHFIQEALPFSLASLLGIGILLWGNQLLHNTYRTYYCFLLPFPPLPFHMFILGIFFTEKDRKERTTKNGT